MKKINLIITLSLSFIIVMGLFSPLYIAAYEIKGEVGNPILNIHKFEQDPKGDQVNNTTNGIKPLPGVTYQITLVEEYLPSTNEWIESNKDLTITKTTDHNGDAIFTKEDGLILGKYDVQEIDAPSHVIIDEKVYQIDIPMTTKDGDLYYEVDIYPKNETIYGDLYLEKQDENGHPLEGIAFLLFKVEKNEDVKIKELVTDELGRITIDGLLQGDYYFQELSVGQHENIALNNQKIYFKIESGKQNSVIWSPVDGFVDENGVVTNYSVPVIEKHIEEDLLEKEIERNKVYEYTISIKTPGDIHKYEKIIITDTLDPRLEYADKWDVKGTDKSNIEWIQDGQTLTWSLKDLTKVKPNARIEITFSAKIKVDAKLDSNETGIPNEAKLDFDNGSGWFTMPKGDTPPPINPPTTPPVIVKPIDTALKIIKVDKADTTKRLEGAQFKLTNDAQGKDVVQSFGEITVNGKLLHGPLEELTTNSNGEIVIEGLIPQMYYLHETKAPTYVKDDKRESYQLLLRPVKVGVIGNKIEEIIIENSKSRIHIPKTGGIGSVLYVLIGLSIIAMSVYGLTRKNKPSAE